MLCGNIFTWKWVNIWEQMLCSMCKLLSIQRVTVKYKYIFLMFSNVPFKNKRISERITKYCIKGIWSIVCRLHNTIIQSPSFIFKMQFFFVFKAVPPHFLTCRSSSSHGPCSRTHTSGVFGPYDGGQLQNLACCAYGRVQTLEI